MSTHKAPISVINNKMSDTEKCSILVPQVVELSEGELSRVNVAMDVVFTHRYKKRFDYFLRQMVRVQARAEIQKMRTAKQPPSPPKLEPIVPPPVHIRKGTQFLLFA